MKSVAVFVLFVAVALAAPPAPPVSSSNPDANAETISYETNNIGDGTFNYAFKTSNGISQQEEGALQNAGTEDEAIEVRGQYEYTAPDGVVYLVTYTAGREGFKPEGSHIPKRR